MNIEEIKKRLEDVQNYSANTGFQMDAEHEFTTNAESDIAYLLYIVERATNFFEKVEEWNSFSKENVLEASRKYMKAIRGSE